MNTPARPMFLRSYYIADYCANLSFIVLLLDCDCMSAAGSLLKRRDVLPGYSYLDISIEKIGMKDPQTYIDPLITVSVKSEYIFDSGRSMTLKVVVVKSSFQLINYYYTKAIWL